MKKQKFFRGDLVQIADDLGASMRHFDKGCKAIVLGTYSELCNDNNNVDDYQLYILPNKGACSWYRTPQLTLIEPSRYDLLPKNNRTRLNWEAQRERDNNGVSLNSIQHPEGNPVPDDHEINPDSLETVEIHRPVMPEDQLETWMHNMIRACNRSTLDSDINVLKLIQHIENLYEKGRADEREACAKLCEDEHKIRLAETIRARTE